MPMIRAGAVGTAVVATTLNELRFVVGLAVAHAWQALRQRHRDRITRRVLESLDDRTLRDIGIDRSEISSVVATQSRHRRHPRFDLV